jgi:DNA-binding response OmpR family regulator
MLTTENGNRGRNRWPDPKIRPIPRTIDDLRRFMSQIRKRIEDDPSNPKYLLTDAYVGYRFCEAH